MKRTNGATERSRGCREQKRFKEEFKQRPQHPRQLRSQSEKQLELKPEPDCYVNEEAVDSENATKDRCQGMKIEESTGSDNTVNLDNLMSECLQTPEESNIEPEVQPKTQSTENTANLEDWMDVSFQEQNRPEENRIAPIVQPNPVKDSSDPVVSPDTSFQQFRPFSGACTNRKEFEALEKRLKNCEMLVDQVVSIIVPYTFLQAKCLAHTPAVSLEHFIRLTTRKIIEPRFLAACFVISRPIAGKIPLAESRVFRLLQGKSRLAIYRQI